MKSIDARGEICPKPVIMTKNAIEDKTINQLEIIVDNPAAKENVVRFSQNFGFEVKDVVEKGKDFHILINRVGSAIKSEEEFDVNEYPCPIPQKPSGKNIFFKSDELGVGDSDLGKLLMKGFIYTLLELDTPPQKMVFMNSGVKLCIKGAITVENLKRLESKGVEILVCGTCLDFYKVIDDLEVGIISNMYDIATVLTETVQLLTV
ncbi:MAG: hypothetical protein B6226_03335 [Candidatus Cloacimonetes bacterium 4572_65]|nr:MAG: hypothetical protein B6226_03335 [Candidatus Cloacimonetes bacterium 4572_65]